MKDDIFILPQVFGPYNKYIFSHLKKIYFFLFNIWETIASNKILERLKVKNIIFIEIKKLMEYAKIYP